MTDSSSIKTNASRPSDVSLDKLIAAHLDGLYGLALRLIGNQQAEDLLHDTVVKCIQNFVQLKEIGLFRPWIYRIMINEYLNTYSKNKAEEELILSYADPEYLDNLASMDPPWETVEETVFRALNWERIRAYFDEIPSIYRLILWCFYIDEMTLDEIAEMQGIPRGTAASRLYRAKQMLMKKIHTCKDNVHF